MHLICLLVFSLKWHLLGTTLTIVLSLSHLLYFSNTWSVALYELVNKSWSCRVCIWFSWWLQKLPAASYKHFLVILKIYYDIFNLLCDNFQKQKHIAMRICIYSRRRIFIFTRRKREHFLKKGGWCTLELTHMATFLWGQKEKHCIWAGKSFFACEYLL